MLNILNSRLVLALRLVGCEDVDWSFRSKRLLGSSSRRLLHLAKGCTPSLPVRDGYFVGESLPYFWLSGLLLFTWEMWSGESFIQRNHLLSWALSSSAQSLFHRMTHTRAIRLAFGQWYSKGIGSTWKFWKMVIVIGANDCWGRSKYIRILWAVLAFGNWNTLSGRTTVHLMRGESSWESVG